MTNHTPTNRSPNPDVEIPTSQKAAICRFSMSSIIHPTRLPKAHTKKYLGIFFFPDSLFSQPVSLGFTRNHSPLASYLFVMLHFVNRECSNGFERERNNTNQHIPGEETGVINACISYVVSIMQWP